MTATPESRLAALDITLPVAAAPVANYVTTVLTGNLLVVSGQLPLVDGKLLITGKLGDAVSAHAGVACARACLINVLAQAKAALNGDLSRITRVVRLGGFIACTPEFTDHATVMNGASDLAVDVFGDAGRHARSTIGVPSLPVNAPVEVEALFEIA
ncbi:RidA family protein [Gluconobacter sp. Dm-62]|uniref:RidA family protein n=1 Tax=Gluconobacter sp. Dm-62 TaxID=2799804 RepID=UPI001B8CD953|nr:RidA family protein [Gluconobacter sp. Dm-62]MBS1103374.1 RidA family protein [Gluconobacter sp. Dm-62]